MTDRSAPKDDVLSDQESELVFAYVDGTLDPVLRAEFELRLRTDPSLRAEIEGMQAVRSLLDQDALYGRDSLVDVPPPHLFDAILRAEVAARPDEIRQAVALAHTSVDAASAQARPWWARLSSWLVGGGVVVGATAALLFVVTQTADLEAPVASAPAQPVAPPAPVAVTPSAPAAAPVEAVEDGRLERARAEPSLGDEAKPKPKPEAKDESVRRARELDEDAAPKGALVKADVRGSRDAVASANTAGSPEVAKDDAAFDLAKKAAPEPEPPPPLRSAPLVSSPSSSAGSGGYRSAEESKTVFLEQMKARKLAVIDREKASARSADQKGGEAKKAPAKAKTEKSLTPTEAREDLDRQKRLDQASEMMTIAERELSAGRPIEAADLAGRAEALGGSAVGLVPASTQTRAFLVAKRFSDSARVGSRLLQADPADVLLVDGMIAGADAAIAIGDRRLAERLLLRALAPANKDAARRSQAQRRLDRLRAPAVLDLEAPASTAPSKSAAPAAAADER